jgi:hypothetical protein
MILFPVSEFIDRGEVLTDLIVDHLEGMQKRFQSSDNFDNEGGVNGMDDKGSMREDTKRDDKEEMEGNLLNKLMIRKVTTKMACFGDQSLSCEQESVTHKFRLNDSLTWRVHIELCHSLAMVRFINKS